MNQSIQEHFVQIAANLRIPPFLIHAILNEVFINANFQQSDSSWYQEQGGYNEYSRYGGNSWNHNYSSSSEYQDALSFLELNDNVTKVELKRAKKRLLNKWHPDKAPAGKEDEYNEMSQRINAAVDVVSKYKGFDL